MTRYQFAKIVQWAGTLRSRKRIQKLVYLLKVAGFPTDAEYILHAFGPYSFDAARLTDELARVGLLIEKAQPSPRGETFDYRLADHARERLREIEASPNGLQWLAEIAKFESLVQNLAVVDVSVLETAATIVYFQQSGQSMDRAFGTTCHFKRLQLDGQPALQAKSLVKRFTGALNSLQIAEHPF